MNDQEKAIMIRLLRILELQAKSEERGYWYTHGNDAKSEALIAVADMFENARQSIENHDLEECETDKADYTYTRCHVCDSRA